MFTLIVHAHALRAAGATTKRVRSVLSLGEAAAAANGTSSATCAAQAGAVGRAHAALGASNKLAAATTTHGAGVCTTAPITVPKDSSGLPLKALGLHGLATVLDEATTDWDSALEVPGGRAGTLLGSGALLNAGCKRCSNVRISKVEWCATLQSYKVYFTLKRSVRRDTELLLFYKVRGARCKCRRSLHYGPALAVRKR